MRVLLCLLSLISVALAKDFNVTDQDQTNIQVICDVASTNPNVSRDARATISNFCVGWEKRVTDSNKSQVSVDGQGPEKPSK